ncbi:phage tail tape measure protein [Paenibacillus puldeungensis]|uniref:Phage tail tape measure protein n=1 Tax=Paenibacillus puldeungensis TaxID=696536 RepID=A0ABW3RSM6_9BACL
METINRQLGAVRRRLQWFRMLDGLRYGLLTGLAVTLLWLSASWLWPMEYGRVAAAICLVLCTAGGWLWGRLRRVSIILAAQTMDRPITGEERLDLMTTALAYEKLETFPAQLQREQAEEYGAAYVRDIKNRLPLPRRRKWWIPASLCFIAAIVLATVPNPMDQRIAQAREERTWVNAQKEELDKRIIELDRLNLEKAAKDPLAKEMNDLRQALEKSREPGQALKNVEETMKRLKEMSDKLELQQRERAEWLKQWNTHKLPGGLAKALKNKDAEELGKQMESFRKQLSGMTEEQRKALAEKLKDIAESAPKNDEEAKKLADALKKAAAAVSEGKQQDMEQALADLNETMLQNMKAADSTSGQVDTAAKLASALAKQGLGLAENMQASGLAVSDTWSMGGNAEQLASGSGAGAGEESSSAGPEGGSGQAPGEGAGLSAGNGSGSGSGSGGEGRGQGQGSGKGAGAGLGSGGRTLVTTPRDLKGGGNVKSDGGPTTGGNVQKGGKSPVFDGVSRPYEEVYSDYAAEAKESLKRSDLPQSLQSLVENYFTEIDPDS